MKGVGCTHEKGVQQTKHEDLRPTQANADGYVRAWWMGERGWAGKWLGV